jgi:flagellar basal-body rod protein FlgF
MKTIEIAAQAMQADMQRLAHISQNIANAQTAGYKRLVTVQQPFAAQMEAAEVSARTSTAVHAAPGALRATGNALDVVVDGEGFFTVQTAQGQALARHLSLQLDAQGRVVTAAGDAVLGQRGELRAGPGASALRVDAQGEVWAGERSLGRLQVVRRTDNTTLQPLGNGLYAGGQTDPINTPSVKLGYLEASNVNTANEMVHLLETSRHFEALSRTVQASDEALEKAIRKLGDL